VPELPEVETIRRGLEPRLVGRFVAGVKARDCRIFQVGRSTLAERLRGQKVAGLSRRGKYLVLTLERHHLVFHFGMTGQLTYRDPDRPDCGAFKRHPVTGLQQAVQHAPDRHTHLRIRFQEGGEAMFRDIRKFGRIFLLLRTEKALEDFFRPLGPEPFTPGYTFETFLSRLSGRKLSVKSLLLDQRFLAGWRKRGGCSKRYRRSSSSASGTEARASATM